MTDDARRPRTEEERARIHAARRDGDMCAGCGRVLVEGEPVWWVPFVLRGVYGRASSRRAPVGRECASPEFVEGAEAEGVEHCLNCGRGIYYGSTGHPRDLVLCSKRCRSRYEVGRTGRER